MKPLEIFLGENELFLAVVEGILWVVEGILWVVEEDDRFLKSYKERKLSSKK